MFIHPACGAGSGLPQAGPGNGSGNTVWTKLTLPSHLPAPQHSRGHTTRVFRSGSGIDPMVSAHLDLDPAQLKVVLGDKDPCSPGIGQDRCKAYPFSVCFFF